MNKLKAILAVALVSGLVVSGAHAHPISNTLFGAPEDESWFTVENIHEYGDDLDARSNSTVEILTGHPLYVTSADDVRMLWDMGRIHVFVAQFKHTQLADGFNERLNRSLWHGDAEYVIVDRMTIDIFIANETVSDTFQKRYCLVDDPETVALYERRNGSLYRYAPSNCPASHRPPDFFG